MTTIDGVPANPVDVPVNVPINAFAVTVPLALILLEAVTFAVLTLAIVPTVNVSWIVASSVEVKCSAVISAAELMFPVETIVPATFKLPDAVTCVVLTLVIVPTVNVSVITASSLE